jgi:hypothetical protein
LIRFDWKVLAGIFEKEKELGNYVESSEEWEAGIGMDIFTGDPFNRLIIGL